MDVAWETIGYAAMVLVTLSLMMRSIVRLRWINLAGAVLFTIYGIAIAAYPVAALNAAIIAINVFHLVRLRTPREEAFSTASMPADSEYVRQFIEFHHRDIARSQPAAQVPVDGHVVFVLRDAVPAGIVALRPPRDGVGQVTIDFATPAYRDLRVGDYLFNESGHLQRAGYSRLVAPDPTPAHRRYLERMGFRGRENDFVLDLSPIASA